jgi:hypothetical protein
MTRSAPETPDLEQERDRAPRHWLQRLVRCFRVRVHASTKLYTTDDPDAHG